MGYLIIFCVIWGGYHLFKGYMKTIDFEDTIRRTIYCKTDLRADKYLIKKFMNKRYMIQILRAAQIMRDSLNIATNSKNTDTAFARMNLAEENYNLITDLKEQKGIISDELMAEIYHYFNNRKKSFHTDVYLNVAQASIDKAKKLKTDKSRIKYNELAKETLRRGLEDEFSDRKPIQALLDTIK